MAIVKVKRPKLRWFEHLYLPAILKGLSITLRHAIDTLRGKIPGSKEMASSGLGVTMQYPEHLVQRATAKLLMMSQTPPGNLGNLGDTSSSGRRRWVAAWLLRISSSR